MRQRVDKLRRRCQALLAAGEEIQLEAEATCKLGYLSEFGAGRAYLTGRRIIWIRRSTPLVRPLLFWIPGVVAIELASIERLQMIRDLTRAWLRIETDGKTYAIRPGKGPYPTLRDNPRTTEEWLHTIQEGEGRRIIRRAELRPIEAPKEQKLAAVLLMLFSILSTPLWLVSFLLVGLPPVFFIIMGAVTLVGLGTGFLMLRAFRGTA